MIGLYINYQKEPTYFIEESEQDYDKLVIRGRAYYTDGCYKGSWISDSFNIDGENGILSYNYRRDSIDVTFINPGQATFYFVRHKTPPERLTGFYCDLYDNKKARALLVKVKNDTEKNLLQNAKQIFKENEDFFKKDFTNYTNNSEFYTNALRDEV